jgi:hypothetical protein
VVPLGAVRQRAPVGDGPGGLQPGRRGVGSLPHDHARSRAYRWGEDGLAGFCDVEQRLCLGLALWNGRDPILKERAFGLTEAQGNHGEDVRAVLALNACQSRAMLPSLLLSFGVPLLLVER